jgi:hypothetical protein
MQHAFRFPACAARRCVAAFVFTLAILAHTPAHATSMDARCTIAFSGSSTLHDWQGTVPPLRVVPRTAATPGGWDADLVIEVADLRTDNNARDERMRQMFDAAHFPEIRAELRGVDPAAAQGSGHLPVSLTIRDVTRRLDARLSNWKEDGPRITFDAEVPVSLAAFSLEAPTVLGLVRVADQVLVTAHVVVTRDAAP